MSNKLREALVIARAGLVWYQENYRETFSECDYEALEQIDAALASQQDHIPDGGQMVDKSQAQQPTLVEISEYGEGQENDCPECGAESGESCSSSDGVEYGRKVHESRQSQSQQEPVKAIPIGFDYLDNGQLVATYAVPVRDKGHPKLYTEPQAQQESRWISVEEAKTTLKDGDLIFAYCEFYGVIEATYALEEGYYNPHRIVKKNGGSFRINTFTHFMVRKPEPLPPAPEGE